MSDLAYKYNEKKNPDGGHFPGVPLADLTTADFAALPRWLQQSVAAAPFYEEVKPKKSSKKEVNDG